MRGDRKEESNDSPKIPDRERGWGGNGGSGHQTSLPSLRSKFDGFAVQDTSIFVLKGAVRELKINEAESRHKPGHAHSLAAGQSCKAIR